MKASFIIATLALAASVSAQTSSDMDLATNWCKVFNDACTKASATVCGLNFVPKNNDCIAAFKNGKCTDYQAGCACVTAAGVVMTGSIPVLETTFAGKKKQCS